jgi:hypothetical protein
MTHLRKCGNAVGNVRRCNRRSWKLRMSSLHCRPADIQQCCGCHVDRPRSRQTNGKLRKPRVTYNELSAARRRRVVRRSRTPSLKRMSLLDASARRRRRSESKQDLLWRNVIARPIQSSYEGDDHGPANDVNGPVRMEERRPPIAAVRRRRRRRLLGHFSAHCASSSGLLVAADAGVNGSGGGSGDANDDASANPPVVERPGPDSSPRDRLSPRSAAGFRATVSSHPIPHRPAVSRVVAPPDGSFASIAMKSFSHATTNANNTGRAIDRRPSHDGGEEETGDDDVARLTRRSSATRRPTAKSSYERTTESPLAAFVSIQRCLQMYHSTGP